MTRADASQGVRPGRSFLWVSGCAGDRVVVSATRNGWDVPDGALHAAAGPRHAMIALGLTSTSKSS